MSYLALNMLRSAAVDVEPAMDSHFEERVVRLARLQQVRESLRYWMPALAGGTLACAAVFAALHLVSRSAVHHPLNMPAGEARREVGEYSSLELPNVVRFDR